MNFEKYKVNTIIDLMNFFQKNLKYGFTHDGKIYTDADPNFQQNFDNFYKIRLGDDFIENGYGVCWDFCELEREFFVSNNIRHKCYFMEGFVDRKEGGPTHTFALFNEKDKWYWFEYSWGVYRGIWKYNSENSALQDILNKFASFNNLNKSQINIYETEKVTEKLDSFEFVEHCLKGKKVVLEKTIDN